MGERSDHWCCCCCCCFSSITLPECKLFWEIFFWKCILYIGKKCKFHLILSIRSLGRMSNCTQFLRPTHEYHPCTMLRTSFRSPTCMPTKINSFLFKHSLHICVPLWNALCTHTHFWDGKIKLESVKLSAFVPSVTVSILVFSLKTIVLWCSETRHRLFIENFLCEL